MRAQSAEGVMRVSGEEGRGLSVSDFLSPLLVSSSLTPAVHLFFLSPPPQCSTALFTSTSACVAVLGHQFYLQITWFVIHWYSLVFQNFSCETCTILSPSNAGICPNPWYYNTVHTLQLTSSYSSISSEAMLKEVISFIIN